MAFLVIKRGRHDTALLRVIKHRISRLSKGLLLGVLRIQRHWRCIAGARCSTRRRNVALLLLERPWSWGRRELLSPCRQCSILGLLVSRKRRERLLIWHLLLLLLLNHLSLTKA